MTLGISDPLILHRHRSRVSLLFRRKFPRDQLVTAPFRRKTRNPNTQGKAAVAGRSLGFPPAKLLMLHLSRAQTQSPSQHRTAVGRQSRRPWTYRHITEKQGSATGQTKRPLTSGGPIPRVPAWPPVRKSMWPVAESLRNPIFPRIAFKIRLKLRQFTAINRGWPGSTTRRIHGQIARTVQRWAAWEARMPQKQGRRRLRHASIFLRQEILAIKDSPAMVRTPINAFSG